MNNQFSFCRFWHVLVWTLVYHWRQLLTLFSVAVIAFATFEMFACIQARNDYAYKVSLMHENETVLINSALRGAASSCATVGAVLLCIGAAFAFYQLHHRNESRRWLMQPASNMEKFVARWVVYVPVLFVIYVVAFMLGDLLRMAVWPVGSFLVLPCAEPVLECMDRPLGLAVCHRGVLCCDRSFHPDQLSRWECCTVLSVGCCPGDCRLLAVLPFPQIQVVSQ